jgi:hypothetical protein
MADKIDAPRKGLLGVKDRVAEATKVAAGTKELGEKLPSLMEAKTAQSLGEVAQTGVDTNVNPLAKSAQLRQESAKIAADTKAKSSAQGYELRAQAVKMAGDAASAETDAYNKAYAAIAAEKARLEGFGGWMTPSQKKQFREFKARQIASIGEGGAKPSIMA